MAEVAENDAEIRQQRARSAKPHQRAKSARHRSQNAVEVNKLEMSVGSSSVDSGTESVIPPEEVHSSDDDDRSPPRDLNEHVKRVDQTIPWKKERPATSVSTRRQRPKSQTAGSAKPKNNRPKSCHITSQYTPDHPGYVEYLRPFSAFRPPLKRVVNIPDAFSNSQLLQHPNLSEGQKSYLWHTASVYSVSNLKQLQQRRYEQMIQHQVDIGLHNPKECERYIKYLLGQRKRQFEIDPRVWRNPPRIAPRGRYYHKRDKTVDYESSEEEDEPDVPPKRPQTAVASSGYGRPRTSKSRPQTATASERQSKSRPKTAATASTEEIHPKPAYEKRFPSGQPSDKQLYYDTKDRQLKSPDQREKEEERRKEKQEKKAKKKEKKDREQNGNSRQIIEPDLSDESSENNSIEKETDKKKKEQKSENNDLEAKEKETSKKSRKKKESSKKGLSRKSKEKENMNKDKNDTKVGKSHKRSTKKNKKKKEPVLDDEDDVAIKIVQEDNENGTKTENKHPGEVQKDGKEEGVDNVSNNESQVQIVVNDEPDEFEDDEQYDDIGEFNPIFENRLKKQQQEDTISVYSSFSVDIPIVQTQAPSELEY
ncbi:uncharacterized protein [Antedon mediterranea]|uniref:uncharacterized protein isoform X2 n=1 Tax=Antedon mediterranea TaxID=105859 RepID=UPI003AF7EA0F